MSYIRVNLCNSDINWFEQTAQAIDDYLAKMNSNIIAMTKEVDELARFWEGRDYIEFKNAWNSIIRDGSCYAEMRKALTAYASFLRHAGSKYKNAQIDAINRANNIQRILL